MLKYLSMLINVLIKFDFSNERELGKNIKESYKRSSI